MLSLDKGKLRRILVHGEGTPILCGADLRVKTIQQYAYIKISLTSHIYLLKLGYNVANLFCSKEEGSQNIFAQTRFRIRCELHELLFYV